MADDGGTGERTEQATPKKKEDARERGQVLKSNELVMTGCLLIMFVALRALMPLIAENLMNFTKTYLSGQKMTAEVLTTQRMMVVGNDMILGFLNIMLPILVVAVLAAILVNVVQVGFLFSTKAMQPKMERLNVLEGFKRLFSTRALFELAKAVLKVVVIGYIIYSQVSSNLVVFPAMMRDNYVGAIQKIAEMVFDAALQICMVLAIIAAVDYMYQRWRYEKDLRMSKYEIKMEMKSQEGDPQIKGKIKQKQREMSMMRMMQGVPDADVVITNPTHYAVALKYDESKGDAPMVIAKGKERVAQKIKEVAKENNVEIVEDRELARGIYAYCNIGDFIPVEMYQAVAEILAQIFRAKNKR